ncbi:hypothetical protein DL98DRAFT_516146, partial [Cadophora sp. DSE1049]
MSQPVLRHLRRVQAFWRRPSDDTDEAPSSSTDSGTPQKVRSLLRVLLKNPWDDYSYIRHLGQTTGSWPNSWAFLTNVSFLPEAPLYGFLLLAIVMQYRIYFTKLKRSSLSPLIRDGIIASLLNSKDVTFSLLDC